MSRVILLDAGPLGIVTKRRGVPDAEACRAWVARCLRQGARILVTSAFHMRRSRGLCARAGFQVVPFPVDCRVAAGRTFEKVTRFPRGAEDDGPQATERSDGEH